MLENLLAAILTLAATVKSVSFGIWTIKRQNITGGLFTILLAMSAFSLMLYYFVTLFW